MTDMLFADVTGPRELEEADVQAVRGANGPRQTASERLLDAAENGDQMKLRHAVEIDKADINNSKSADNETAMHILARKTGSLAQMQYLHMRGADFAARGPLGATPLHIVCDNPNAYFDKIETIKYLASVAPECLNAKDEDGLTPLLCACQTGQIKTVKVLLELGADPLAKSNDGHNSLFICTQFGHLHTLYFLCLEQGYDVHERDNEGRTCLHWAAYHNHLQICAFLRRLGLSPNDKDDHGCTPLHWAAVRGHDQCFPVLVMAGGRRALDERDAEGLTPMQLARKHNHTRVLAALESNLIKNPGSRPIHRNMKIAMVVIAILNCACAYCFTHDNDTTSLPMKVAMVIWQFVIWWSLWKCYKTDPGRLNVDNDLSTPPLRMMPKELQRFAPLTEQFPICYTCNARRVLRSKHSQYTNTCVARFDHYCPWTSNDIGVNNQSHFFTFLASVALTTGFGTRILRAFLWDDATQQLMSETDRHYAVAAMVAHPVLSMVTVLDLVVVLLVGGLSLTLLHHAVMNMTTNEMYNWSRYHHLINYETGRFTNPFFRGVLTNVCEYFGCEKLPGGGRGRLVNWRNVPDIQAYKQWRNQLGSKSEELQVLTNVNKAV